LEYQNLNKAYFKEFPFLIQKTIEERGGTFKFSPRNSSHVEVNGNLITGQNYLSSKPVALKIIEVLENRK
jgi:putative intracellular protease/amidase